MNFVYKQFQSNKEIELFFHEINTHINTPIEDWYKEDGLVLYGYYYDKDNIEAFYNYFLVFGKTIAPSTLPPLNNSTIFSKLKYYGSSKKYKGIKDIEGKVLLSNSYDEIDFFYRTEYDIYLIVRKDSKKGIYIFENNLFSNIVPLQFDDFFDAGEYTWGYIKDGNVGFMSLEGKIIIDARYRLSSDFNQFTKGKALVCLNDPNGVNHYINHYGDCIGYPESESSYEEHMLGTGYYPYGDLPDVLDAFEGDESNFWNID